MEIKIVTAAIIKKDGKILIARRKKNDTLGGMWEFPGGTLSSAETPQQCLRRELKEELNIDARIGECIATNQYMFEDAVFALMFFEVRDFAGSIQLNAHDEIRWVFPHELDDYNFPKADWCVIQKLKEGSTAKDGQG